MRQINPTRRWSRPLWLIVVIALGFSTSGLAATAPPAGAQTPVEVSASEAGDRSFTPSVVGGSSTLNPGYVVALLRSAVANPGSAQFCGGSLIAADVVLTAAHCVDSVVPADIDVAVGATFLSSVTPADRVAVADIAIHPGWSTQSLTSVDIALIRLSAPVTGAPLVPIESTPSQPETDRPLIVTGWGYADPFRTLLFDAMQAAGVATLTGTGTTPALGNLLCGLADPGDDFCFGGVTTAACNGDSGGPLLGETSPGSGVLEVAGLVSYGPAAQCLHPSAFDGGQRVSPYKTWIDNTIDAWTSPPPTTTTTTTTTTLPPVVTPSAPGAPEVNRSNGEVTLTWSPPADDGGDPALSYTATGSPAGSCTTTATTCQISGLTNGIKYSFTVTASNSAGAGQPSAPSTAVLSAVLVNCSGLGHVFVDVPASSFAYSDVGCLSALGVTNGTGPNTYSPSANVTREQMAAFIARLYRTITGQDCGTAPTQFVDVSASSFAYNDVGCLSLLGVTNGTGPNTYSPAANVTREQMAAFIARLYRTITKE